jgi:hypothetical protein
MFRMCEVRLGLGVLYTPRAVVSTRPKSVFGRHLSPFNDGPLSPCDTYRHKALELRGISKDSLVFTPYPAFPLPVAPGRNGDSWAFPRASHPAEQDPATHVGVGTGHGYGPDYVFDLSRTSFDVFTQHKRPHVATDSSNTRLHR